MITKIGTTVYVQNDPFDTVIQLEQLRALQQSDGYKNSVLYEDDLSDDDLAAIGLGKKLGIQDHNSVQVAQAYPKLMKQMLANKTPDTPTKRKTKLLDACNLLAGGATGGIVGLTAGIHSKNPLVGIGTGLFTGGLTTGLSHLIDSQNAQEDYNKARMFINAYKNK